MSRQIRRWPYNNRHDNAANASRRIVLDAVRWDKEFSDSFNLRTLERLTDEESKALLERDVLALDAVEDKYGIATGFPNDGPLIPCPICKSKQYLIPSMLHPKIMVCDRPNCVYDRTRERVNAMIEKATLRKVVNE